MASDRTQTLRLSSRSELRLSPLPSLAQSDKGTLATSEVARTLGISCRTLRLWAECGEIPATRVGRQWRFHADQVNRWIENGCNPK